jgi:hypothetical protein
MGQFLHMCVLKILNASVSLMMFSVTSLLLTLAVVSADNSVLSASHGLPASYISTVDQRFQAKPLMEHQFKPPQKKPNPVISSVFLYLLTVAPLLGMRKFLNRSSSFDSVKDSVKASPSMTSVKLDIRTTSGIHITSPVLFNLVLLAYVGLLVGFFVFLNLVQTVLLGSVVLVFGFVVYKGVDEESFLE